MAKTKTPFLCSNCGAQSTRWEGRCVSCNQWNTLEEITIQAEDGIRDSVASRGLGDVYKRQPLFSFVLWRRQKHPFYVQIAVHNPLVGRVVV